MSAERDVNRIVRSWIRTDEHESADRVLQAVLSRLDTTPQRRPMWPTRRFAQVNTYAKLAASAAILVVAVVGYQLIPAISGPATPTTAPSPTVTPAPTEVPRLPSEGPIDAGTYQTGGSPSFLVTVPAGWVGLGGLNLRKHVDEPTELALDTFATGLKVYTDACQSEDAEQAIGPTAEDLVDALQAQQNSEVSDPVVVTIGSLRATRLEISAPDGLDLAACTNAGLQIWVDSRGENYLAWGNDPSVVVTVYIVDAGSGRLVLVPHHQPSASASDVAELDAIVASVAVE